MQPTCSHYVWLLVSQPLSPAPKQHRAMAWAKDGNKSSA